MVKNNNVLNKRKFLYGELWDKKKDLMDFLRCSCVDLF